MGSALAPRGAQEGEAPGARSGDLLVNRPLAGCLLSITLCFPAGASGGPLPDTLPPLASWSQAPPLDEPTFGQRAARAEEEPGHLRLHPGSSPVGWEWPLSGGAGQPGRRHPASLRLTL